MKDDKLTAKQVASRDITEACKEERRRLRLSASDPMGPQNCLPFEEAIREYAGVESRPDFRKFNGGHNRVPVRIYVTFYTADSNGVRKDVAVKCVSEDQVYECKKIAFGFPFIRNIRVNKCGEIKNKSAMIISFDEFKNLIEL